MKVLIIALMVLNSVVCVCQDGVRPEPAGNKKYGLKEKLPIKVGGGMVPSNVYSYLEQLTGPNGEEVLYERIGSGPSYKNPDPALTQFESGVLTMFYVWYGNEKRKVVYFDQYRLEQPQVLHGFLWKE
ncbi:MAG: hypothetical protein EA392_13170 [Cryomorphaceae bacterium]|nr:MAG: hypothetical protein EA392_13170 [Cryomorphaceae bacterium]